MSKNSTKINTNSNVIKVLAVSAIILGLLMLVSFCLVVLQIRTTGSELESAKTATSLVEFGLMVLGVFLVTTGIFAYRLDPPRTRRGQIALVSVVGVILAIVSTWAVLQVESSSLVHSRKLIPLVATYAPSLENPNATDDAFRNLTDTTSRTCRSDLNCVQAAKSDRLVLYRFSTRSDARDFADSLGERGYQSDWIVVEFTDPSLPQDIRQWVKEALDGTWTSR